MQLSEFLIFSLEKKYIYVKKTGCSLIGFDVRKIQQDVLGKISRINLGDIGEEKMKGLFHEFQFVMKSREGVRGWERGGRCGGS